METLRRNERRNDIAMILIFIFVVIAPFLAITTISYLADETTRSNQKWIKETREKTGIKYPVRF